MNSETIREIGGAPSSIVDKGLHRGTTSHGRVTHQHKQSPRVYLCPLLSARETIKCLFICR